MMIKALLDPIQRLHRHIRQTVVSVCEQSPVGDLARVAGEGGGDTIYEIDRVSEALLIDFFQREVAPFSPLILIAEGLSESQIVLPSGTPESEAQWYIIVDPIDGTRGLMYQKRSGWILTGVAPNRGSKPGLHDIELAVQTEIPLIKQHLSDSMWAIREQGVKAERYNRLTGKTKPLTLIPSQAQTIAHGFAMISRFFPGARDFLAALDEEIVEGALGPVQPGRAACFEDQYICSGGQLYELMIGHDRFVADLRPLLERWLARQGKALGICCHPYDLCTELIARELGVITTDARGNPLQAPLDVRTNVDWVGYANTHIQAQIEPLLQAALRKRNLLD